MKKWINIIVTVSTVTLSQLSFADMQTDLYHLQKTWAQVNYSLDGDKQKNGFIELVEEANNAVENYPNDAEVYIWRGIIESSYAGAKGGLGALSLAEAAKADLEHAMQIDEFALSGSALTSLGTLYSKVPGWPLGFGDDDKAKSLLEKAVRLNPNSIDANYFYAQFLMDKRDYKSAEQYLLKAQQAPARPERPLADKGRHEEIKQALLQVKAKLKPKSGGSLGF